MAPWQFEFGFVPSIAAKRHWTFDRASMKPAAGIARSWNDVAFAASLAEPALPARWRDAHGNYVDVRVDGGRLLSISAAIDLRMPYLRFVSDLTLTAIRQEWLATTSDGRMFRPVVRRFLYEIQRSPAMRCVRGPEFESSRLG